MSAWFKNIQGQLTDLANEVLSEASDVIGEATQEVADVETELTVAKKKCAEAEKKLAIESSKNETLENEKKGLEQQLYDVHVEMDTIGSKFNNMVQSRDAEIKKLKHEIEQINQSGWNDASEIDEDNISDLKKEIAHWKSLASQSQSSSNKKENMISKKEFENKIDEMRQKKEAEIQALIESHADSIVEMREMYEEKIQAMQVIQYNASSSTSNVDTLDAVLLDKEELIDNKKHMEDMVKSKTSTNGSETGERPVLVEIGSRDELAEERIRQVEAELERCREEKVELETMKDATIKRLQDQNLDVERKHKVLENEFEEFKKTQSAAQLKNSDLTKRLNEMKSHIVEYEQRYEMCKRENNETVGQLEKLTADFEKLKSGVSEVNATSDALANEEVAKLREALEESRTERERLRADVQGFKVSVGAIDNDLEQFREANRRLMSENATLSQALATYEKTTNDLIKNQETDLTHFREQLQMVQEKRNMEIEQENKRNEVYRSESEALRAHLVSLQDQSGIMENLNSKLKEKAEQEEARAALLEEKIDLLEKFKSECLSDNADKDKTIKQLTEKVNKLEQREVETCDLRKFEESDDPEVKLEGYRTEVRVLRRQLYESLDSITEAAGETESRTNTIHALEREVEVRQNCVDEMISQTNALQRNQDENYAQLRSLQERLRQEERDHVATKNILEEVKKEMEEWKERAVNLDQIIVGDERVDEGTDETSDENTAQMRGYIQRLKAKNEELESAYRELHEKSRSSSEAAHAVREKLEHDLREAEIVDMNILAGLERRLATMETDLSEKNQKLVDCHRKETELMKKIEELRMCTNNLEKERDELKNVSEHVSEDSESMDQLKTQIEEMENYVEKVSLEKKELYEQLEGVSSNVNDIQEQIISLNNQNMELKQLLTTKHEESVQYYTQLEQCLARNQQIEAEMEELRSQSEESRVKLGHEADAFEKRGRELERLKQHLMLVEETSTREAVESETRETELRQRVRELEARGNAVQEGATESTQQYQIQIASLTSQLESIERVSNEWKMKFDAESKAREQTQEALTSLQTVVRELSVDHERDSASSSHQNLELQTKINALVSEMAGIRDDLDRQSIGKQAAEEETDRIRLQLDAKQRIVEDLEVQIEELRAPAKTPKDSYRVDDSTLRQLFLNYFSAEPSKRPDIALLLASILEYPSDEMEKFRAAVRQSFGQSSFTSSSFFGSRTAGQQPAASLTEQFIRFLEVESESSKTAPHLPVRTQAEPPPQISLNSHNKPPTSMPSNLSSSSSSAAALDSLLR